jgi:hypothetical protein
MLGYSERSEYVSWWPRTWVRNTALCLSFRPASRGRREMTSGRRRRERLLSSPTRIEQSKEHSTHLASIQVIRGTGENWSKNCYPLSSSSGKSRADARNGVLNVSWSWCRRLSPCGDAIRSYRTKGPASFSEAKDSPPYFRKAGTDGLLKQLQFARAETARRSTRRSQRSS